MVYFLALMLPVQSREGLKTNEEIVHKCGIGIETAVKEVILWVIDTSLIHPDLVTFKSRRILFTHGKLQIP